MKRIHIVGGVLAAAALAGGGAALDAALTGPGTPAAAAAPSTTGAVVSGATGVAASGGTGVAASGGTGVAAPGATAASTGIGTAALSPGTALVDGAGRTLYLFEADTGTTSTCNGACAQVWPPVPADGVQPDATGAVQAPLIGTGGRPDGSRQVTYHGHPLYYFAGDRAPGDARGQGIHNFGGGWYVVAPDGNKIDTDDAPAAKPAPAAGSRSASSGGGYGY